MGGASAIRCAPQLRGTLGDRIRTAGTSEPSEICCYLRYKSAPFRSSALRWPPPARRLLGHNAVRPPRHSTRKPHAPTRLRRSLLSRFASASSLEPHMRRKSESNNKVPITLLSIPPANNLTVGLEWGGGHLVAVDPEHGVDLLPGSLVDPQLEGIVHLIKLLPAGLGQVQLDLVAGDVLLRVREVLVAVDALPERGQLSVVDLGQPARVDGEDVVLLVENLVICRAQTSGLSQLVPSGENGYQAGWDLHSAFQSPVSGSLSVRKTKRFWHTTSHSTVPLPSAAGKVKRCVMLVFILPIPREPLVSTVVPRHWCMIRCGNEAGRARVSLAV